MYDLSAKLDFACQILSYPETDWYLLMASKQYVHNNHRIDRKTARLEFCLWHDLPILGLFELREAHGDTVQRLDCVLRRASLYIIVLQCPTYAMLQHEADHFATPVVPSHRFRQCMAPRLPSFPSSQLFDATPRDRKLANTPQQHAFTKAE